MYSNFSYLRSGAPAQTYATKKRDNCGAEIAVNARTRVLSRIADIAAKASD
jgi:hypothetical protein